MITLSTEPVRSIMTRDVITIDGQLLLKEAAELMLYKHVGCLVVINRGKPNGILTEREFVRQIRDGNPNSGDTRISDVMAKPLISITPSTTISKAFQLINNHGIKRLPVLQNGKLKGLLSLRQILNFSRYNLIKSAGKNRSLQREANRDVLTGLYNKRYLINRLREEYKRLHRYGFRCSLIFLDIDHFKKINDELSHIAGDYILTTLGKILRKGARSTDIIARYGGEEFVIITPYTKPGEAAYLANKLRESIEKHPFSYRRHKIQTTISAGVANLATAPSVSEGLARADKALLYAKQHGRNVVYRWKDPKGEIIKFTVDKPK